MNTSLFQKSPRFKTVIEAFEKYGFGNILKPKTHRESLKSSPEQRLKDALQESGRWFVLLGKWLAYRPDLIPGNYCKPLLKLHDNTPPIPITIIKKRLAEIYSRPIDSILRSIQYKPLESTTTFQTHKARLVNGEQVLIKILGSKVEKEFKEDIHIMKYLLKKLKEKKSKHASTVSKIINEFNEHAQQKLDLSSEETFLANSTTAYGSSYIPKIYSSLCTKEVIVFRYEKKKNNKKNTFLKQEINELGHEVSVVRGELFLSIAGFILIGMGIAGKNLLASILGLIGIAMLVSVVILLIQARKKGK